MPLGRVGVEGYSVFWHTSRQALWTRVMCAVLFALWEGPPIPIFCVACGGRRRRLSVKGRRQPLEAPDVRFRVLAFA